MSLHFTKTALTQFCDTVGQQGLVKANTATAWRVACTRILEDVADGDDVRSLDLPSAVIRYNNRHPGDLSPSSLKEYQRRLELAIRQFTSYVNDPTGYKGYGRRLRKANGDRRPRNERPVPKKSVVEEPKKDLAEPPRQVTPGLSLEFPMRPDFLAQVVIPRDMKVVEARRFSRFILTLAQDYQPPDEVG
jgi:hypothetical protein